MLQSFINTWKFFLLFFIVLLGRCDISGANGAPHSIEPTGRFQSCHDPKGFNGTLLPGQANTKLLDYYTTFQEHVVELFGGRYGHNFVEVWLDGGYPQAVGDFVADFIDTHQPNAVIFQAPNWNRTLHSGNAVRWAGTETGHTPNSDMWSTVSSANEDERGNYAYGPGSPEGDVYMPAEQDAAIQSGANEGGFWYPGEKTKTVDELVSEYEDSVGHNSNYMLELSPDRKGHLPAGDVAAYAGFGQAIQRCYGEKGRNGNGDVARIESVHCDAIACQVSLSSSDSVVDRIRIRERDHTRFVRKYDIFAATAQDGAWTKVANGSSVGRCRIHRITPALPPHTTVTFVVVNATQNVELASFELMNLYGDRGCMTNQ